MVCWAAMSVETRKARKAYRDSRGWHGFIVVNSAGREEELREWLINTVVEGTHLSVPRDQISV